LLLLLVLQRTCELIKDSSLWRSNFILSVHDSIIIIGPRFCYFLPLVRVLFINVGSRFAIKSEFFSWVYIPISLLGLNGVLIEVRIIWYQSLGFKIRFTILLPFVSCYHPILFLLCSLILVFVLYCAPGSKKKETSQKKKKKKHFFDVLFH
jgi:hypothetical protein